MRELRKIIRKQNSANWHQVFTGCGLLRVILHHPDGGECGDWNTRASVGHYIRDLVTSEELAPGSGKKMLLKVRECRGLGSDVRQTSK